MTESSDSVLLSRRGFLKSGLIGLAAAGGACLLPTSALALARTKGTKELSFHNLHTGERLRTVFWKNGHFEREGVERIHHILRDHRSGEVHPIAPNLLELLHDLQTRLRTDATLDVISAFRSPQTNARLAGASRGVATRSLHTTGEAIDIRMRGVSLRRIQTEALFMARGGVGFYPKSDFVHVDVGRVRRWG